MRRKRRKVTESSPDISRIKIVTWKNTAQACYEKAAECYKAQSRYTSDRNSCFGRKQPRFTVCANSREIL